MVKFNANGTVDTGFGTAGQLDIDFSGTELFIGG